MPDPPDVGLLTRYVFENPWPLGVLLFALAVGAGWTAAQREHLRGVLVGVAFAVAGAAIFLIAAVVTTSGEHGEAVTRDLVEAAVAGNVANASARLSDSASMSFGAVNSPGITLEAMTRRLKTLAQDFTIDSNRISTLRGYSVDSDRAIVHLGCVTTLATGYGGPTPTQWVLEVSRVEDETWKVSRITWITLGRQRADSGLLR